MEYRILEYETAVSFTLAPRQFLVKIFTMTFLPQQIWRVPGAPIKSTSTVGHALTLDVTNPASKAWSFGSWTFLMISWTFLYPAMLENTNRVWNGVLEGLVGLAARQASSQMAIPCSCWFCLAQLLLRWCPCSDSLVWFLYKTINRNITSPIDNCSDRSYRCCLSSKLPGRTKFTAKLH